jgi:hypothetical protein
VATMKICQDDLNKLYVDHVLIFISDLSWTSMGWWKQIMIILAWNGS